MNPSTADVIASIVTLQTGGADVVTSVDVVGVAVVVAYFVVALTVVVVVEPVDDSVFVANTFSGVPDLIYKVGIIKTIKCDDLYNYLSRLFSLIMI